MLAVSGLGLQHTANGGFAHENTYAADNLPLRIAQVGVGLTRSVKGFVFFFAQHVHVGRELSSRWTDYEVLPGVTVHPFDWIPPCTSRTLYVQRKSDVN